MRMNNNEYTFAIEYYGENVAHGEPIGREDVMKTLQRLSQEWEEDTEEYLQQEEDEEEMAQWNEFDAYQDFTEGTAVYPEDRGLEYTALGLASEAGEYAGKIKKMIRDGSYYDIEGLASELGDVLWYVARAAAELDLYLSDVAEMNIDKLKSRMERGKIGGSGDDR